MTTRRTVLRSLVLLALSVVTAQAQIARNGVTSGSLANATTLSWSHTTGGSNRFLIVGCKSYGADDIVSVTYNSVALTQIRGYVQSAGGDDQVLFGLTNPASGANTVTVTRSVAANIACDSVSYEGVKQTGQPEASGQASDTTSVFSISPSTTVVTAGSWLVMGCSALYNGAGFSGGTATTMVIENSFLPGIHALFDSNGTVSTGAQALQCNRVVTGDLNGIIAALAPAAGGGGGGTPCLRALLGVGCEAALWRWPQWLLRPPRAILAR